MAQPQVSLYEGLFLLNQHEVAADLNAAIEHLQGIFSRAGVTVEAMKKWGERRLAYPIKGQKRGTFVLVYLRAPRDRITQIERDCNLSEIVLRNLVIRAEHIGQTEWELIQKEPDLAMEARLRSDLSTPVTATTSGQAANETVGSDV